MALTQEQEILKLFADNGGRLETRGIPYRLSFEYRRAISVLRKRLVKENLTIIARKLTRNNWEYRIENITDRNEGEYQCTDFDEHGQGDFYVGIDRAVI